MIERNLKGPIDLVEREWRTGRFALELRSGMACKNSRQHPTLIREMVSRWGRGRVTQPRRKRGGREGTRACALSILRRYSARQSYGADLYIYRYIYIACARSAVYFRVQGLWEMTARLASDLVEPDGRPRTRSSIRCGVLPISRPARQTRLFRPRLSPPFSISNCRMNLSKLRPFCRRDTNNG